MAGVLGHAKEGAEVWTAQLGGEVINLENMSPNDKMALRVEAEPQFRCRGCGGRVHTRQLDVDHTGDPFIVFAHNPGEAAKCRALGLMYDESPEHDRLKRRIARAGRRAGWDVDVEVQPDSTCRADVVATHDGRQWVFEAQLSQLALPTALERHGRYTKAFGGDCTWIHTNQRDWSTRIPSLQIDTADTAVVVAGIKTDPTGLYDAQPEAMDSVIPRVLTGGLNYIFLDDFGYYVDLRAQAAPPRLPASASSGERGRYVSNVCDRAPTVDLTPPLQTPFMRTVASAHDPERLIEIWEGRARMARARMAAGMRLDDIDIEALDRSSGDRFR